LSASNRQDALRRIGLCAVAIFPVAAAVFMDSTLYDGVRHLMFVQPVLVVLAAAGWSGLLQSSRPSWLRAGAALAIATGMASLIVFNVRFHPNQVVYFNSVVDGPRGAFARYEMDYWGNCILQAAKYGEKVGRSVGTPVIMSGYAAHLVELNAARLSAVEYSHEFERRHHMYILTARGEIESFMNLTKGPALFHVRTPDGAVLCSVEMGPAYGELGGPSLNPSPRESPR
jgi:hypothetical protein